MQLIQTAKLKLNAPLEELLPTFQAYTSAFNFVAEVGYQAKKHNSIWLHQQTYQQIRADFKLPAQLACSSRKKAAENLKAIKGKTKKNKAWFFDETLPKFLPVSCPHSALMSIHYDCNSYSLNKKTRVVSLLTLEGRKKFQLDIPAYYEQYFAAENGWEHASADLIYQKRNQQLFLCLVFKKEIPDVPATGIYLGIDRGINNLAATSDNKFYGGKKVQKVAARYQTLRSALQAKGTRSAKRHLRQLSGKEQRFKADTNHCIAKEIIESLKAGDTIVLEDLTHIRKSKKKRSRDQRRAFHSWAFLQLEQFLIYKAIAKGIRVVFVPPAWTSQTCPGCHFQAEANRKGAKFECQNCGYKLHADLIGARNIASKHLAAICCEDKAAINQPNGDGFAIPNASEAEMLSDASLNA